MIEFITQRFPEHISSGDVICLFSDEQDGTPSGKYTVANVTPDGGVTLVGMGHLEGTIAVICMGDDDD
jgi:hypothetical protein